MRLQSKRKRLIDTVAIIGASGTLLLALISLFLSSERSIDPAVPAAVIGLCGALLGSAASLFAFRVTRSSTELDAVRATLQELILMASQILATAPSDISVDVYIHERRVLGEQRLVRIFHEQIGSAEGRTSSTDHEIANQAMLSGSGMLIEESAGTSGVKGRVFGMPINKRGSDSAFGSIVLKAPTSQSSDGEGGRDVLDLAAAAASLLGAILFKR